MYYILYTFYISTLVIYEINNETYIILSILKEPLNSADLNRNTNSMD